MPSGDPRLGGATGRRLLDAIDRWVGEISPGAHLSFDKIVEADAILAGFSFDREGDIATRRFRATNVGFGLSYTLPVLTALLAAPRSLCLVENPETHLHPRGQTRMAEFAVRAALAGVQVVVETHSDHFLDGVRIAVRDGLLAPEDIAIHYFERRGSKSTVTSPGSARKHPSPGGSRRLPDPLPIRVPGPHRRSRLRRPPPSAQVTTKSRHAFCGTNVSDTRWSVERIRWCRNTLARGPRHRRRVGRVPTGSRATTVSSVPRPHTPVAASQGSSDSCRRHSRRGPHRPCRADSPVVKTV